MNAVCPQCRRVLEQPLEPGPICCPSCGHRFASTDLVPEAAAAPSTLPQLAPPDTSDDHFRTGPYAASGETAEKLPRLPQVPGYEVLSVLGRGGMGVVYRARQTGLNRPVALKMIRSGELADDEALSRFKVEAEAAARLQHPNIVQVYETGACDGLPFFSLEFIDGGSLREHLAGRPLAPEEAARLVEVLAWALDAAHHKGVIHRDLKPANILLQRRDEDEDESRPLCDRFTPKVADFGLAKRLDSDGQQTQSGQVMGTPSYMAPEQAAGRVREIGPATDVYALGAILYELQTGRPPFVAASSRDIVELVLTQEPVPPRQMQPKMPADLETICLKCLQKEPDRRYPSARELADDLRRFLDGVPITARPVGVMEQGWRWCRRRPVLAGLITAVALLAVALVGGSVTAAVLISAKNASLEVKTQEAQESAIRASEAKQNAETAQADAEAKQKLAEEREKEAKTARAATEEEKKKVEAARTTAEERRKDAEAANARDRISLYYRNIALAQKRWFDGEVAIAERLLDECPPERRGWEWDYLKRLCRTELLSLTGYTDTRVSFTASGKHLIVNGSRVQPEPKRRAPLNEVSVWSWETGKQIVAKATAGRVQFSDDGELLTVTEIPEAAPGAVPSFFGTVRLLDGRTGEERLKVAGEASVVGFSPDSKLLLVSHPAPKGVEVLDIWSKKTVRTLEGTTGPYVFSPDGKLLLTGELRKEAGPGQFGRAACRVLDLATGRERLRLETDTYSLQFSADGKRLTGTASRTTTVDGQQKTEWETHLWDLESGKSLAAFPLGTSARHFSPDGRWLVLSAWVIEMRGRDQHRRKSVVVVDARTGEKHFELPGHPEPLLFSADGKSLLAVPSVKTRKPGDPAPDKEGPEVLAWDLESGKEATPTPADRRRLIQIAFASNRQWLAQSGGDLATLNIFEGYDGRYLGTFPSPFNAGNRFQPVSVSPDGKRVAIPNFAPDSAFGAMMPYLFPSYHDVDNPLGSLQVWDLLTGKQALSLREPGAAFRCAAFSPDGTRIAGAGSSNNIKLWDLRNGQEVMSLRGHVVLDRVGGNIPFNEGVEKFADSVATRAVERLTFSPDGFTLVSEGNGTVKVWDLASSADTLTIPKSNDEVQRLRFSRDGKHLLAHLGFYRDARQPSSMTKVYDVLAGRTLYSAEGNDYDTIDFSPDGRRVVTGQKGICQVRDASTWAVRLEVPGQSAFFGPDGGLLYAVNYDRMAQRSTVKVWDVGTGLELYELGGAAGGGLAISPDGKRVVWGGSVRDAASGRELFTVRGAPLRSTRPVFGMNSTAFTPDGSTLATADEKGEVRLIQASGGKELHTLALGEPVLGAAFSPDGARLTLLGQKGAVVMLEVGTGTEFSRFRAAGAAIVSSDGDRVVSVRTAEGKIRVGAEDRKVLSLEANCWEARTGKQAQTKLDNLGARARLALSPDGKRLGCTQGVFFGDAVELWDLTTGQLAMKLPGPQLPHMALVFSPDGMRLAGGGMGPIIQLWDAAPLTDAARTERFLAAVSARRERHEQEAMRLKQNQPEAALFHLDRALEQGQKDPSLWWMRARLRAEMQDWAAAAADFARVAELGYPTFQSPLGHLLVLHQTGDHERRRKLLAELLEKHRRSEKLPEVWFLVLMLTQFPDGASDWKAVLALAEKVAKANPAVYEVQVNLGAALFRAGKYDEAVEQLGRAGKLSPGQVREGKPEYLLWLALAEAARKRTDEARQALQSGSRELEWLRNTPDAPPVTVRPMWEDVLRLDLLKAEAEAALKAPSP